MDTKGSDPPIYISSLHTHPGRKQSHLNVVLSRLPKSLASSAQFPLIFGQVAPQARFLFLKVAFNFLSSSNDGRSSVAEHILKMVNKQFDLIVKSSSHVVFNIILFPFNGQSSQTIDVVVILNFFLKVIFERIIKRSFFFEIGGKKRNIASQSFCEITECFSCQNLSIGTLQNKLIVVFLSILLDESVSEDGNQVDRICCFVEHSQYFVYLLHIGSFFAQNLLYFDNLKLNSSFFLENLLVIVWQQTLLLHMNTSQFIKKFVFLIPLHNIFDDCQLNKKNSYQTDRIQTSRQAYQQITLFLYLKCILQQQSHLILHHFEQTFLADWISLVKKNGSSFCTFFAECFDCYLLRFLLLFVTVTVFTFQLIAFLPLTDVLQFLLNFGILVLIAPARQLIIKIHRNVVISFIIQLQIQMGNSTARLLLIGLDNAGKSTILSRIIDPDETTSGITPTIGYKKDTFTRSGVDFQVLDMSGESKYRDLWQSNATHSSDKDAIHGIIFVVDCSDKMRIRVAKSELDMILDNKNISSILPFLFYANKNDLKGSCQLEEVSEILDLKNLKRNHQIISCSGLTGRGIQEGIGWLCQHVKMQLESDK